MGAEDDERAVARLRELLLWAVRELRAGQAPTEALARFESARRRMLVTVKSKMVPLGRVWRLGVVLLDEQGGLYATGSLTRAVDPKWRQYVAQSMEVRRDRRGAAFRGPFAAGESVDFDARPIEVDAAVLRESDGPVLLQGGRVVVLWAPGTKPRLFEDYLRERVDLAVHPPEGDGRS
ncbi:MAG TPA: hypothetical protein VFQ96_04025 [Microbacteriaceae bacterium]|nr:hypothetical protein [Microbacteriaceae bacterium]